MLIFVLLQNKNTVAVLDLCKFFALLQDKNQHELRFDHSVVFYCAAFTYCTLDDVALILNM